MANINAAGTVVSAVETDGTVVIGVDSAKKDESGNPSFTLSLSFPAGSAAIQALPVDTILTLTMTTVSPMSITVPASVPLPVEVAAPVIADPNLVNAPIEQVKAMLGIAGGAPSANAPTVANATPSSNDAV